MAVDESVVQRRRGRSEIGCKMASRVHKILVRTCLPTEGPTPTVAEPREEVVRIDVFGRHPEYQAVRPTPEGDLPEESRHVGELAGLKPSQNVGLPISRVEKLVRLEDDIARSGRDPQRSEERRVGKECRS